MEKLTFLPRTRIKICGITRLADAVAAAEAGADAIGFVFHPASPRFIEPDRAGEIIAALPPFVTTVGLFVDVGQDVVERTLAAARLDALQFHGDEAPDFCGRFARPFVKALRVRPEVDLLNTKIRKANGDASISGSTCRRSRNNLICTLTRRVIRRAL